MQTLMINSQEYLARLARIARSKGLKNAEKELKKWQEDLERHPVDFRNSSEETVFLYQVALQDIKASLDNLNDVKDIDFARQIRNVRGIVLDTKRLIALREQSEEKKNFRNTPRLETEAEAEEKQDQEDQIRFTYEDVNNQKVDFQALVQRKQKYRNYLKNFYGYTDNNLHKPFELELAPLGLFARIEKAVAELYQKWQKVDSTYKYLAFAAAAIALTLFLSGSLFSLLAITAGSLLAGYCGIKISGILANLEEASKEGKEIAAQANAQMEPALNRLYNLLDEAEVSIAQLNKIAGEAEGIVEKTNQETGPLIENVKTLLNEAGGTLTRINETTDVFKNAPGTVFNGLGNMANGVATTTTTTVRNILGIKPQQEPTPPIVPLAQRRRVIGEIGDTRQSFLELYSSSSGDEISPEGTRSPSPTQP